MRQLLFVLVALTLVGCPRPVPGDDAGGAPDAGALVDANYRLPEGNLFEGPILLDDARVEALDPTTLRAGSSPCGEPVLARVVAVTDGDTVRVHPIGETFEERVRMIGVDTPEIAHEQGEFNECYGPEARTFTNQLYQRLVWLTFDGDCRDQFDRLLAYVHVGAGQGDLWERQLLRRGFASVLTIGANRAYSEEFMADESAAFEADVGMWGSCF